MAVHRLAELVKLLAEKTVEGRLLWEKTVEGEAFQTAFPGYSVRLRTQKSKSSRYPGADAYAIQIFNESGELVEETTDEDLDGVDQPGEFFAVMREMHIEARRSVMGVDKAIDSILEQLSSKR
ncbi:MAG TPA: hypothetical protein VGC60_12725 [Pyrinomonadaceae bacterium]|jgi:hypothetical protein